MAKDERIFRVTKQGYSGRTTSQYKSRTAISAMFAGDRKRRDILKVEAIDPADIEWADVTDEFRDKPAFKGCYYHRGYTGVRKPAVWNWKREDLRHFFAGCSCTALYLLKHPEYPTHDVLCSATSTDPAGCACQILKKVLE